MSRGHVPVIALAVLALCAGVPISPDRDAGVCAAFADTSGVSDLSPSWLFADENSKSEGLNWTGSLATGYDAYVQTYSLALEDTTEQIQEMDVTLAAEGRTSGRTDHRWRLAPALSVGSERTRQRLDLAWSHHPDGGAKVMDALAELRAVQYQGTTDYSLSSDYGSARTRLRWFPSPDGDVSGELRAEARTLRYTDPSALEANRHDLLVAASLRSGHDADQRWSAGLRAGRRAYPDTSAIDRTTLGVDLEMERFSLEGPIWRATLRSERRVVRDESVRPSNWAHWGSLNLDVPLSPTLDVMLEAQGEWWNYDVGRGAYVDQVRWVGLAGVRAPAITGPGWSLGAAWETLGSDDETERYQQLGLRGGLEQFGAELSLSLSVEVGRRDYGADEGETLTDFELGPLYTDFTYTEVWFSGTLQLNERLNLNGLASWLPESHSQDEDDQSLGFFSLHAVLRF